MAGRRGAGSVRALVAAAVLLAACGAGAADGGATAPRPSATTVPSSVTTGAAPAGTPSGAPSPPDGSGRPPVTPPPPTTSATTSATTPRATTSSRRPPATAVPGVPALLSGRDVEVLPTSRRVAALTFDAGANGDGLPSVLATLRSTGTPATFFLTGDFVETFPGLAKQVVAAGHTVGNHTQDHLDLTTLTDAAVRTQVLAAQRQILAATGVDARPWFRFPLGARDARTIRDVNDLGYACVRWTVDTLGWKGTSGGQSVTTVVDRVLAAARPGGIVLMHVGSNPDDGTTLDADALGRVVAGLRDRGYTFVALDDLLS